MSIVVRIYRGEESPTLFMAVTSFKEILIPRRREKNDRFGYMSLSL